MREQELMEEIQKITSTDKKSFEETKAYQDTLAKPPGSLGELEVIACRIAAITGQMENYVEKRCVMVFSADNGVVEEGIASGPQSLTLSQTQNMLDGLTGVAVLAKHYHSDLWVTDVGINGEIHHPQLISKKIRYGTDNIMKKNAMTREEAVTAIGIGIETVKAAKKAGYQVIGIGEMGIGNTTTSSTVLAALLQLRPDEIRMVVGRGAGLTDLAFRKKLDVVKRALEVNRPKHNDPIDVIAKVGGFDLAAMCGAYLGAAIYQIPVVIDGFISIVAALCAVRMEEKVRDYLFLSHCSHEKGYLQAQRELDLKAALMLDMRLGEGSGCPIMFEIMETACMIVRDMATFQMAKINTDYLEPIRDPKSFE